MQSVTEEPLIMWYNHRCTSQGVVWRGKDSGKAIIFWAKAKLFGQKPPAKNEKNVFIKRKKNGIYSVTQNKMPEIRDFY